MQGGIPSEDRSQVHMQIKLIHKNKNKNKNKPGTKQQLKCFPFAPLLPSPLENDLLNIHTWETAADSDQITPKTLTAPGAFDSPQGA